MKRRWYIVVVIMLLLLVVGGGCLYVKKNNYSQVLGVSGNTSYLIGNEDVNYDIVNNKIEQIISSYQGVSSFMVHFETSDNAINEVELTLKCNVNLSDEDQVAIKQQLTEFLDVSENDVFVATVLCTEE